jgi:hypothetical protein
MKTLELLITEFEYKNEEGVFTMFTLDDEILAIEHEGYDVTLMNPSDDEMTLVSEKKIQSTDVEIDIHNHFVNV